MTYLTTLQDREPDPTIVITCEKVRAPGKGGDFALQPRVSFTNMPGSETQAWELVHQLLGRAMHLVALEMVRQANHQGRIAVVPTLPGEMVKS